MKEGQKNVRQYLAAIGKRGGLASCRELTRLHAKQMSRVDRFIAEGGRGPCPDME
jgi:hypothetical protein